MALITMKRADGQTMTIEETSPLRQSLLNQGWSVGSAPTAPVVKAPVVPANLNTTPLGAGGVNALFKQYYGRNATQEELNYWSQKSDAQLRPKLIPNSATELARNKPTSKTETTGGTTGTETPTPTDGGTTESDGGLTAAQKTELDRLNSDIDNGPWSAAEKAILKQIAGMDFTSGSHVPTASELAKIVDTATTNATESLNPYYTEQTRRELEDLKNGMEDIRNQTNNYVATETAGYKAKLAETKASLRASGRTFSGIARATLGSQGAIDALGVEGTVPEARRLGYNTTVQTQTEAARKIGLAGERLLGSSAVGTLDVTTPYGTSNLYNPKALGNTGYIETGDLALDRLKAIEERKNSNLAKTRLYI